MVLGADLTDLMMMMGWGGIKSLRKEWEGKVLEKRETREKGRCRHVQVSKKKKKLFEGRKENSSEKGYETFYHNYFFQIVDINVVNGDITVLRLFFLSLHTLSYKFKSC